MNAGELLGWGERLLKYLAAGDRHRQDFDPHRVAQEFGGVQNYRQEVEQGRQLVEGAAAPEQFGKAQGLSPSRAQGLPQQRESVGPTPRTQQVCTELVRFVAAEAATAHAQERSVGSSEVIESVFGKWKRVAEEQAGSGLTGLVLSLGALVSRPTAEVIKKALAGCGFRRTDRTAAALLGRLTVLR